MFESAELDLKLSKEVFDEKAPEIRARLLEAQARLDDTRDFSVAIVVAGAEGSGKGETINTLLSWMDARGIESHALGAPTEEEASRPAYFRYWRRLPPQGRISIFFGSWYTLPILTRSLGQSSKADFEQALSKIVDFERMLVAEDVLLLKFWLHITRKQQKKRFKKLEADPDTAWRVTSRDWKYHETYEPFARASAHALRRTSTGVAPWTIIPAHDRRYRKMTLAQHLLEALEQRLDAPSVSAPERQPAPVPAGVNVINSIDLSPKLEREEYERLLSKHNGRLGQLARRLGEAERSAVLVFEGTDAAGKGGAIRRVLASLDARFYRVIRVAAPTEEERARPYLWRFWRHVPKRGHVAIFDRSWYGRVLVERVEELCAPSDWQRAYAEINSFEDALVDAGTLVFKFWLAISPAEQLRRLKERQDKSFKRYKITPEDWRNREQWAAYEAVAGEMVEHTSTEIAPWHLVSAEDKLWARVHVLEKICEGLERAIGPDEPPRRKGSRKRTTP